VVSIGLSLVLLGLICWIAGAGDVLHGLIDFPPWAVAGMLALMTANLLMVTFRFWKILAHFDIALPWRIALQANLAGNMAGFVVISLVGHVIGRQMILQRFGVSPIMNASLAGYERALLMLVSGSLGTLGGIYLLGQRAVATFVSQFALPEIAIAVCGGVIVSVWWGRSTFEKRVSQRVLSSSNIARMTSIVALTVAAQVLMLGAFMLGIFAVADEIPVLSLFAAAAAISLAAALPITINGWGLREMTAVYVLGNLGVTSADAVSVSVMIGLCATAVTLAASFLYLRNVVHV